MNEDPTWRGRKECLRHAANSLSTEAALHDRGELKFEARRLAEELRDIEQSLVQFELRSPEPPVPKRLSRIERIRAAFSSD
jgi:hypothetical protein